MTDWYRIKTWTQNDEEEFWVKFERTQKDIRPQYLRVQAVKLIETKDKQLLYVAETLLNKILTEYPDNRTEKSQTFNSLGQIYRERGNNDKALEYFKKSLAYEKEFPNVITTSYLDFSETVIEAKKTEMYDEVENLLLKEINNKTFKFPIQNYITYSALAAISNFKGDFGQAKIYSVLAEQNAIAKTNGLWNSKKNKFGTVKERKSWLDRLLKK